MQAIKNLLWVTITLGNVEMLSSQYNSLNKFHF